MGKPSPGKGGVSDAIGKPLLSHKEKRNTYPPKEERRKKGVSPTGLSLTRLYHLWKIGLT